MIRRKYTQAEIRLLDLAEQSVLTSMFEEKGSKDVFGDPVPGRTLIRKLDREGLLFETEEDPIDLCGRNFSFTPMLELTELGRAVLRAIRHQDAELWSEAERIAQSGIKSGITSPDDAADLTKGGNADRDPEEYPASEP